MANEFINPEGLAPPQGRRYTHVVKAGRTVYISGQTSRDVNGDVVGEGDIEAQYHQVWHNVKVALDGAGATVEDIVKLTMYVVGEENIEGLRKARASVQLPNPPANTMVVVTRLADPRYLLEIEAIAETG